MKGQIDFMDYNKLNELKKRYGNYEEVFKSGDYDKAADILGNVLDVIEEEYKGGTRTERKYLSTYIRTWIKTSSRNIRSRRF